MLGGRAFKRRVHSDEHVPRLVEEAEDASPDSSSSARVSASLASKLE